MIICYTDTRVIYAPYARELYIRERKGLVVFDVHGSVHRKYTYIRFDIFPTKCNFTQFIYFWKTAIHVSGGIFTHHQEHI